MPRVQSNTSLGSVPEPIHKVDSLTFLANAVLDAGEDNGNGKRMVKSSSGTGLSYLVSNSSKVKQEQRNLRSSYEKGIDLLEGSSSNVGVENDSNFSIGLPLGGFGNAASPSKPSRKRAAPSSSTIPIPLSIGSISSSPSLNSLVTKVEYQTPSPGSAQKQQRKKKRPRRSKEESKAKHRMVERRRTKRLNELINSLKEEVMDEETQRDRKKSDKVSVLIASLEAIRGLKRELRKANPNSEWLQIGTVPAPQI